MAQEKLREIATDAGQVLRKLKNRVLNEIEDAASRYAADVRARRFPGPDNIFGAVKRPA